MKTEHLIEKIVLKNQYRISQKEKEKTFTSNFKKQIEYNRINPNINSMYNKLHIDISKIQSLEQIPFIPVNMFKKFDLLTCNKKRYYKNIKFKLNYNRYTKQSIFGQIYGYTSITITFNNFEKFFRRKKKASFDFGYGSC